MSMMKKFILGFSLLLVTISVVFASGSHIMPPPQPKTKTKDVKIDCTKDENQGKKNAKKTNKI